MEIIKKKYDIDEDRIINGLSNIVKDKENLEINLNLFLKTLSVREKLFYDLTIQSIIEMPSYEKVWKKNLLYCLNSSGILASPLLEQNVLL